MRPNEVDDSRHFARGQSREDFRAQMLKRIPWWYSPWVHLATTTGIGIVSVATAVLAIRELRLVELLVVPVTFVLSNLNEWHAHRNLLHRRFRPVAVLYDRHTPEHHRVYRYEDMAIRSVRELRLVLIPAMGVLGLVITSVPLAVLLAHLLTPNSGWLFVATVGAYVVSYELTHLSYHLPAGSFIGRRSFVRVMREHHARHHDPRLMQQYNFNVTVPLGDWIFGTMAPKELVEHIQRSPTTNPPVPVSLS
jgi:hypothetical protein